RVVQIKERTRFFEPLVIPDCRVNLIDFPDIASQRPGRLLFLGVEVPANTPFDEKTMSRVKISFLGIETTKEEIAERKIQEYYQGADQKLWRRFQEESDPVDPQKLSIVTVTKVYRQLRDGMEVKKDALLGLIDSQQTLKQVDTRLAKIRAAEAQVAATVMTQLEAKNRYDAQVALGTSAAKEEVRGSKLTWQRLVEEEKVTRADLNV